MENEIKADGYGAEFRHKHSIRRVGTKRSARTLLFLEELEALQRKHDVTLGREDGHGAFEVTLGYSEADGWVSEAVEIEAVIKAGYRVSIGHTQGTVEVVENGFATVVWDSGIVNDIPVDQLTVDPLEADPFARCGR